MKLTIAAALSQYFSFYAQLLFSHKHKGVRAPSLNTTITGGRKGWRLPSRGWRNYGRRRTKGTRRKWIRVACGVRTRASGRLGIGLIVINIASSYRMSVIIYTCFTESNRSSARPPRVGTWFGLIPGSLPSSPLLRSPLLFIFLDRCLHHSFQLLVFVIPHNLPSDKPS